LNRPTIQETPDRDEISITPPYFNKLPIQETPDGNQIKTSSESNISPQDPTFIPCFFKIPLIQNKQTPLCHLVSIEIKKHNMFRKSIISLL
jgi:hypothetical protein